MKRLTRAKRRDANEPAIVQVLQDMGASILRLDEFDLLVGYHGHDLKVEVKMNKGRITESQNEMLATWRGSPLHIIRSPEEMVALLNETARG